MDEPNKEQAPAGIGDIDAINNLDTARMALRWALERLHSIEKLKVQADEDVRRAAAERERHIDMTIRLGRELSEKSATARELELRLKELERTAAERQAQFDRFSHAQSARLERELLSLKEQLEDQFQARVQGMERLLNEKHAYRQEAWEQEKTLLTGELEQLRQRLQDAAPQLLELRARLGAAQEAAAQAAAKASERERAWEAEKGELLAKAAREKTAAIEQLGDQTIKSELSQVQEHIREGKLKERELALRKKEAQLEQRHQEELHAEVLRFKEEATERVRLRLESLETELTERFASQGAALQEERERLEARAQELKRTTEHWDEVIAEAVRGKLASQQAQHEASLQEQARALEQKADERVRRLLEEQEKEKTELRAETLRLEGLARESSAKLASQESAWKEDVHALAQKADERLRLRIASLENDLASKLAALDAASRENAALREQAHRLESLSQELSAKLAAQESAWKEEVHALAQKADERLRPRIASLENDLAGKLAALDAASRENAALREQAHRLESLSQELSAKLASRESAWKEEKAELQRKLALLEEQRLPADLRQQFHDKQLELERLKDSLREEITALVRGYQARASGRPPEPG